LTVENPLSRRRDIPEIVPIVLSQLTRLRAENAITDEKFETQLDRLTAEELQPRGLVLKVRELPEGHRRFVIQDAKGAVRQTIECNGTCNIVADECADREEAQAAQRSN
jgi:hypothetical protein